MMTQTPEISVDVVEAILSEEGYEVVDGQEDNVFHVRDLDTGLRLTCVLEDNILFNTLSCFSASESSITPEMMRVMLDAENGISTSSFQLYSQPDGQRRVALTNFCKLQDLGPEDRDDILSCISFLLVDVMAARQLLSNQI